jgi:hypothetical protein
MVSKYKYKIVLEFATVCLLICIYQVTKRIKIANENRPLGVVKTASGFSPMPLGSVD